MFNLKEIFSDLFKISTGERSIKQSPYHHSRNHNEQKSLTVHQAKQLKRRRAKNKIARKSRRINRKK